MRWGIGFGVLVVGLAGPACVGASSPGTSSASAVGSSGATGPAGGTGSGGTVGTSGGGSTTGKPPVVTTFAGNCGTFGDDTAFSPQLLAVDGAANVYVADDAVDRVTPAGATLLGSSPSVPNAIAVTFDGGLYYVDTLAFGEHTAIYKVGSGLIFNQPPSCNDSTSDDAGFGQVVGMAVDGDGTLYVADEACTKVRKRGIDGTISTVAGNGLLRHKDGAGDQAEFSELAAIAIDSNGALYVYESDSADIRKIEPDGTTRTIVTKLTNVGGIVVAADGTIYFSNFHDNTIGKVTPDGTLALVAGNGVAGLADGPASVAEFNSPLGLGLDPAGNLFVADSSNCVVREITGL